jgi:hypothetical protein
VRGNALAAARARAREDGMNDLERAIGDLVIANRILAKEDVVDAYGHVSIRHPQKPDHYLLSRSLSPEFVSRDDIIEFRLDGTPVSDTRPAYLERFIHGCAASRMWRATWARMCRCGISPTNSATRPICW